MVDAAARDGVGPAIRSEAEFRQTFERLPVGAAIASLDLRFQHCNRAFCDFLGYEEDELKGRTYVEVTHPEDVEVGRAELRELVSGTRESYAVVKRYVRKDGQTVWGELTVSAIPDKDGTPAALLPILVDVTARKHAEDALRHSEAQLQAIFQHSRDAIGVFENGIHVCVNPAYLEMLGFDNPDDVVGKSVFNVIAPSEHLRVRRYLAERARGGAPSRYVTEVVRRNGTPFSVEACVSSFKFDDRDFTLALLRDVTEQLRTESAIAKSEEKFSKAFATTPQAAIIMNIEKGVAVEANRRFYEHTGYKPSEVIGRTRKELKLWVNEAEYKRYAKELEANRKVRGFQAKFRLKSGEVRDGEISSDLLDIDGVRHSLNFVADVTDRLSAEAALQEAQAELERRVEERTALLTLANQELESFSYSVSHDLRAPLRAMDGFSRILIEDYGGALDDEGREYLRRISDAAERMGRLVDDLLKLARINQTDIKVQKVDLGAISLDVVRKLHELEPERKVDVQVAGDLKAEGDAELLYSAMDNLIGNSWKYTSRRKSAHIEVAKLRRDGRTIYYVRDDGAGFDMTFAGRLFGPFQRLHRETDFPGTGIGLATVQRIVRRHRGDIWAEAEVDKGATFYFTLGTASRKA